MQASRAAGPVFQAPGALKKPRPKTRPTQVFWPTSRMPYLAATEGTLKVVWQRMGQEVQPLPRTVYCQACLPRKYTKLLVR